MIQTRLKSKTRRRPRQITSGRMAQGRRIKIRVSPLIREIVLSEWEGESDGPGFGAARDQHGARGCRERSRTWPLSCEYNYRASPLFVAWVLTHASYP